MKITPKAGFALLSVLVFVVLLTVLVTSFLVITRLDRASTQNYSKAAKAQELALSGLEEIVGDLLMEIEAGSLPDGTPDGSQYTQEEIRVFVPIESKAAMPARIGFEASDYSIDISEDKLSGTLLRVSRGGPGSQYPSFMAPDKLPPNRASLVSSKEQSGNGRWITPEKWNKPLLLGSTVPTPFQDRPPDWIYVTRNGSRACFDDDLEKHKQSGDLSNPDQVLGRYAFTIYDEGGLLDMNAAGFPSDVVSTAEGTIAAGGKTAVSYADLTQLPGLSGKQAELDAMVQWRNKGSIAEEGDFIKLVPKLVQDGFLKFRAQDSPLLSRQDLIGYFKKKVGTTEPIPFLGTFSRAVNAPTWAPTMNSSEMPGYIGGPGTTAEDYKDNADQDESANRKLPNLRSKVTRRHYKDDGTLDPETIQAGEPLVARRFSLAKLAWLTPNGPQPEISAQAVYDCFGLRWVEGQDNGQGEKMAGYWEYAAASSEGGLHIKTLHELVDEKREPNFFELLKAGILSGSLGKDPGSKGPFPEGPIGYQFGAEGGYSGYSEDKDRHILQIGANIIDQADTDSLPTAIHFDAFSWGSGLFPEAESVYNTLYGNENLPYLTRLFPIPLEYPTAGRLSMWIQPEIWNPHQAPAPGNPTPPPTHFRVRSYGIAYTYYDLKFGGGGALKYHTEGNALKYEGADKKAGIVYFTDSSGTSSSFYNKPAVLTKNLIDTAKTAITNYYDDTTGFNYPANKTSSYPDFAGISVGYADIDTSGPWIPDPARPTKGEFGTRPWMNPGPPSHPNNDWHVIQRIRPSKLTISLECSPDGGTTWYPYSFISRLDEILSSDIYTGGARTSPFYRPNGYYGMSTLNMYSHENFYFFCRPDPRTDRFSVQFNRSSSGPWESPKKFEAGKTMESGDGQQFGAEGRVRTDRGFVCAPGYSAWSTRHYLIGAWAENQTTSPFSGVYSAYKAYYADPDGVLRAGDGANRDTSTGDGCLLFHADATGKTSSAQARRPVILNRPFQSVGELGYTYRDLPFKTLDLFTPSSADSALLDLFAVTDAPVIAGRINPNNAPKEVLQAVLAGTLQNAAPPAAVTLSDADAETVAGQIAAHLIDSPIYNAADLATALSSEIQTGFSLSSSSAGVKSANKGNKAYAEAPVRALSAVSNLRTWNLLIDVIAQSGRIPSNAKTGLKDFLVEGEKRYWLHLAIDRYTGKILGSQLEPVYD